MLGINRKKEVSPAPVAPVNQSRKDVVTCDELGEAIRAVCAETGDCSTSRTLQALEHLTYDFEDGAIVKFDGPPPVTLPQFDEALAEAKELDLPAGTLGPLMRFRKLLAHHAEHKAPVDDVPVTRAEFDALVRMVGTLLAFTEIVKDRAGFSDGSVSHHLQALESDDIPAPDRIVLDRVKKAFEATHKSARLAQHRHEHGKSGFLPGRKY